MAIPPVYVYESDNQKDNDQRSFVPDADGNSARNVVIAPGSAGGYFPFGPITVGAGLTVVIDTTLLSTFSRLDYIINMKDNPTTVTKSLKLTVQNNAGSLKDSVSERLGGPINAAVNVTDDAVDAMIEVTNNEAYDIEVTFLKALTP
jgi:hypothetical protein